MSGGDAVATINLIAFWIVTLTTDNEDALLLLFMIELLCHTEAGCFKADRQFGCDFITKRAACKESEVKAEGQETGESNEGSGEWVTHDMCHSLHGETVLQNLNRSEDADTDLDTDDDWSCVEDGVTDEETAEEAMLAVDNVVHSLPSFFLN